LGKEVNMEKVDQMEIKLLAALYILVFYWYMSNYEYHAPLIVFPSDELKDLFEKASLILSSQN